MINSLKDVADVRESMKFLAQTSARILEVMERTTINSSGDLNANEKLLLHQLRDSAVASRHELQQFAEKFFSWHNEMVRRTRTSENEIRAGIREGLEPLGGLIQDLAIERRQWLSTLVPNRSVLRIRLIEGGEVKGVYQYHTQETITVANTTTNETVGWMKIDGIDQVA